MRLVRISVAVAVLSGSLIASAGTARAGACAEGAAGGEWRSYSGDLSNTRHQTLEDRIGPDSVYDLEMAWAFSITSAGGTGGFQSTPVIADGCLYAAGGTTVYALNADTGETVWQTPLDGGMFALAVADGRVYANEDAGEGPSAVALDQATGDVLWRTVVDTTNPSAYTNASAVPFDGMLFVGISGPEDGPGEGDIHPGGFAILDADTGQILKRTYTVPPEEQALGYLGVSIWSTAVIDTDTGHAYAGTGQPANKAMEHEHTNAMLKIDVDPGRATFGEIVDAYKGNVDSYVPGLANQPLCQNEATRPGFIVTPTCGALDIDFGASPTFLTNSRGRTIVGNLQKSGVYHAMFADTMQEAWQTIVSAPIAAGNAGSSANDGQAIYVKSTPGLVYSLHPDSGAINWVAPVADAADYHPVSVANGVVYVPTTHGLVVSLDAATGLPAGVRPLALDTGDVCAPLGGGIAIARNQVYAVCDTGVQGGGWIVSYGFDGDLPLGPLP